MDSFVQELSSMQEAAASVEKSLLAERNKTKQLQQQIRHQEILISEIEQQVRKNEFDHLRHVTEIHSLQTTLMSLAKQVDELLEYKKKLLLSNSHLQKNDGDENNPISITTTTTNNNQQNQQVHQDNDNEKSNNNCPLCSTLVASWNLIQHPRQFKKSKQHASELTKEEFLSKNEIHVANTGKVFDD